MNKVFEIGRLTSDPDVRYSQGVDPMAIARFSMAVDRKGKKANAEDVNADFIRFVAFGKTAEAIEKYTKKGTKLAITGRIQTGSYEKDGAKVYTFEVVVEDFEFCEKKSSGSDKPSESTSVSEEWSDLNDTDLPFAMPTR